MKSRFFENNPKECINGLTEESHEQLKLEN